MTGYSCDECRVMKPLEYPLGSAGHLTAPEGWWIATNEHGPDVATNYRLYCSLNCLARWARKEKRLEKPL